MTTEEMLREMMRKGKKYKPVLGEMTPAQAMRLRDAVPLLLRAIADKGIKVEWRYLIAIHWYFKGDSSIDVYVETHTSDAEALKSAKAHIKETSGEDEDEDVDEEEPDANDYSDADISTPVVVCLDDGREVPWP